MTRRVFFSFHFDNDYWRTQQVRNIGALEGQSLCTPNVWEEVKRKGTASVEKWISDNMAGKSCVVVLVGSQTADRRWVIHEINTGWKAGKGVLAIRIDRLLDSNGSVSFPGANPLTKVSFTGAGRTLADVVPIKVPSGSDSRAVYKSISDNIEGWIEWAIAIRQNV